MRQITVTGLILTAVIVIAGSPSAPARAQGNAPPSIDLPDPYGAATSFGQLPAGREWGGTTVVAIYRGATGVVFPYDAVHVDFTLTKAA
jgi:hypothetical protein